MPSRFAVGDGVHTPFGKGVVRQVRHGRLLIEVKGRSVLLDESTITPLEARPSGRRRRTTASGSAGEASPTDSRHASAQVDLHGLTVDEALSRAEQAVNDALLADLPQLRLIHGQSGGRIRAALHRRLRDIATVRNFRLDPHNPGVTIVHF